MKILFCLQLLFEYTLAVFLTSYIHVSKNRQSTKNTALTKRKKNTCWFPKRVLFQASKQFFFSMLTLLTWNETLYFLIDFWALYGRLYCKVGSFFHLLPFAGNRRTTILPTTSVTWSLYYNAHWLRWSQNCSTIYPLKFKYRRLDTTRMANDWLKDEQCLVRYFLIIVLHLVLLILASIPIHDFLVWKTKFDGFGVQKSSCHLSHAS